METRETYNASLISCDMRILGITTIVWLLASIYAVRTAPIGPEQPEWLWTGLGIPAIFVFGCFAVWCGANFHREYGLKYKINFVLFGLPIVVCIAIWSGLSFSRDEYVAKLQTDITGVVVEKYRSRNHAAPSIRIKTDANRVIELDGVVYPVWQKVAVGDQIQKQPWSAYANINGQNRLLIER